MVRFDSEDRDYIEENFRRLPLLCDAWGIDVTTAQKEIETQTLPRATYVLDGIDFFPDDYFAFPLAYAAPERKDAFTTRLRAAMRGRALGDDVFCEEAWDGYISGGFGVCLRIVLPETIVQKAILMETIEAALEAPLPGDPQWRANLTRAVDALDTLERPFAKSDRERFGGPVSRDRYVTTPRERFRLTTRT